MNLYVVLSNYGIHHDCIGVFKTKEKADDFLNNNEVYKGYIKSVEIIGDYKYPNDVYEANSYLAKWKVHTFIGLYADPTEAETAAGKDGMIIPRSFDDT